MVVVVVVVVCGAYMLPPVCLACWRARARESRRPAGNPLSLGVCDGRATQQQGAAALGP